MVRSEIVADMVIRAMDCINLLVPQEITPDQMTDLETLESHGWAPVDDAQKQIEDDEDNPREVSRSEFQAAWETVNAWMEGMAEQRARDLYAIMGDE